MSEQADTPNNIDDGAPSEAGAPSPRHGTGRAIVAIVSTYLVVLMAIGAVPGPTHRVLGTPLRWLGLDQSWEMFTYPPHADPELVATATVQRSGRAEAVRLAPSGQPRFRWRRFRSWLVQAGNSDEWACYAMYLAAQRPDLAITKIEFSIGDAQGEPRVLKSVLLSPGITVAPKSCSAIQSARPGS